MITASHLPYNRQGFKFFDSKAGFEKKDITELLKQAAKDASQGDLSEDPGFPTDNSQKEESALDLLEKSFHIDASLVKKVDPSKRAEASLKASADMLDSSIKVPEVVSELELQKDMHRGRSTTTALDQA